MIRIALAGGLVLALTLPTAIRAAVSTETLRSISIPDKAETAIGTLEFLDGVPVGDTVDKV